MMNAEHHKSLVICWFRIFRCRPNLIAVDEDSEEASKTESSSPPTPTLPVLLEVVGAMGLATRQKSTVSPYCIVRIAGQETHRTQAVQDDPNPIWTIKTKSLCMLEIPQTPGTGADSDCVSIWLCHGSKHIGSVNVPVHEVAQGNGERVEYSIEPCEGWTIQAQASLALRYRHATRDDLTFLHKLSKDEETEVPIEPAADFNFCNIRLKSPLLKCRRRLNDKTYLRVMPFPDPDRPDQTEWMTREDIEAEALKPSKRWVQAGHGTTGTIFLEVLGCDHLPNLDINLNESTGQLTDCFVGIAFEDNLVRTEMIWDDLHPRWMPWTTRAFAFKVRHPSSILTLAVFDFDQGPMNYHDPIGRVVITTANFRCYTEYTLHYRLHHDPREDDRTSRGTITIRLRICWEDEMEAMKMSFVPAPRWIINVKTEKSYHLLRYIVRGNIDMEEPSLTTVTLYWKELMSSWQDYCYVFDVMMAVILWRGRLRISNTWALWFPLLSIGLFVACVVVIEYPRFLVPSCLYGAAWILITTNYYASRHPNPWKRVKPFEETDMIALFGKSNYGPDKFDHGEGVGEGDRVDLLDELKARRMSQLIQATLDFTLSVYRIYYKTSEGSVKITTQRNNLLSPLDSFVSERLYYVHIVLKSLCQCIRSLRNFVKWKTYSTEVFTTQCIMIATLCLVFPVDKVALWAVRLVVWTLLGPWMKLVDIFWVHRWYETDEELSERLDEVDRKDPKLPDFDSLLQSKVFVRLSRLGRIMTENLYKLKDMREVRYGYYSEILPRDDISRFPPVPLPQSSAIPVDVFPDDSCQWTCVPGQQLEGTMIPTPLVESYTYRPTTSIFEMLTKKVN